MPLETALCREPLSELSTSRTALTEGGLAPAATLAPGFHPEMVPSSVEKTKRAGKFAGVPLFKRKSVGLPLKTTPVGADWVPGEKPGGGTMTKLLNGLLIPLPLESGCGSAAKMFTGFAVGGVPAGAVEGGGMIAYSVDVPELLLPTHHGLPFGERVSPQGLSRLGSVSGALPTDSVGSATRLF